VLARTTRWRSGSAAAHQSRHGLPGAGAHTLAVALRHLIERLASTPSPKTIVLLSEEIVLEHDLVRFLARRRPRAARSYHVPGSIRRNPTLRVRNSPTRSQDAALGRKGWG
jgi:hypothetical protein